MRPAVLVLVHALAVSPEAGPEVGHSVRVGGPGVAAMHCSGSNVSGTAESMMDQPLDVHGSVVKFRPFTSLPSYESRPSEAE